MKNLILVAALSGLALVACKNTSMNAMESDSAPTASASECAGKTGDCEDKDGECKASAMEDSMEDTMKDAKMCCKKGEEKECCAKQE